MQLTAPRNLGISRHLALTIAFIGACMVVIAIVFGVATGGIDATALFTILAVLGTLATSLVGAVKSTETADTAAKTHQTLELTASQQASIAQILMAHCGDICPLDNCPLKGSHVYGTAISVPPGSGIDLAGGERQSS